MGFLTDQQNIIALVDPGVLPAHAPKGPDSFILTHKFF